MSLNPHKIQLQLNTLDYEMIVILKKKCNSSINKESKQTMKGPSPLRHASHAEVETLWQSICHGEHCV